MKILILAIVIFSNGVRYELPMESRDSCVDFTRAIAESVYSADCYEFTID